MGSGRWWMLPAIGGVLLLGGCTEERKPENKLFTETVSRVDSGGISLSYRDMRVDSFNLPELLRKFAAIGAAGSDEREMQAFQAGVETLETALRILNPGAIRAVAYSCRREGGAEENPVYLSRGFWNTGDDPEGLLFDLLGRKNREFTFLKKIPASSLFAADFHFEPGRVWKLAKKAMLTSGNPIVGGVPGSAETALAVAWGIQLPELLDTLEGEFLLLLIRGDAGKGAPVRGMLSVPDNTGALAALLRERMGQLQWAVTPNGWKMPEGRGLPPGVAPEIILLTNRVLLVSDRAVPAELESGPYLKDSAEGGLYLEKMPEQGRAAVWGRLDLSMLSGLAGTADPREKKLMEAFGPWSFSGSFRCADDGYAMTARSNFVPDSLQQGTAQTAILAGMLLPALRNAREKARQVKCMSSLRRMGVFLAEYADQHDGRYPASLSELPPMEKDQFLCPSAEAQGGSYLYLPETAKAGDPTIPLLMEQGVSHAGGVNVAFCDGRVETLRARTPAEVIELLNRRFHYEPGLLARLEQKTAEPETLTGAPVSD